MGSCCSKKKNSLNDNLLENSSGKTKNFSINEEESIEVDGGNSDKKDSIEKKRLCYSDFEPLKLLGSGTFGRVLLVRKKNNNKLYAMKILEKSYIKQKHQEEHTKAERNLMVAVNSPFVSNIKYAFQDEFQLYLVMEFMQGGDMFFHLHNGGRFSNEKTKFYIIELVLAIESLHKNNMIYRDLKPENILMDRDGHIKITDFGLSKILVEPNDKTFTLCGTPQYIAPEVLYKTGYDKTIDWWSLGCILYEFLTECFPFVVPNQGKISIKVYENPLKFPKYVTKDEIDLIKKLLQINPKKRLGAGPKDAEDVKAHKYFKGVNWEKYENKEIEPPFIPTFDGEEDLKYFDKAYIEEDINSNSQSTHRSRVQSDFKGFTYTGNSFNNDLINNMPKIENETDVMSNNSNNNIEQNNDTE